MSRICRVFALAALLVSVACGGDDPTGAVAQCASSPWLSFNAYQSYFGQQVAMECYPTEVSGRQGLSEREYQGVFVAYPPVSGFDFASVHGRLEANYQQTDTDLQNQGYQRIWLQSFVATGGLEYFQATWTLP